MKSEVENHVMVNCQEKSKYVKPSRESKIFYFVAVVFLFSLVVMPQYFGIPTPVFDFTILRIMIVAVLFFIIVDEQRKRDFVDLIIKSKFTMFLVPYLIVIGYTMGLRADINAFLNPFMELLSLYLLIYVIQHSVGVEKAIRILTIFTYVFAIMGLVEYVMDVSPFSYLNTLPGIYTGRFVRSGHYRIMSSCVHSLGYGLLLMTIVPFACLDLKKNKIDIFKNFILLILLALNVFLTGSRSTLAVFLIEVFLLFLLSDIKHKKRVVLIGIVLLVGVAGFLVVFHNTNIAQYIMLQITTIVDEILGTEFSVTYGANLNDLSSSSNYRDQLKYIFTLDWLNPFLGIGRKRTFSAEINGSFIKSVDNFYIAEYIRYAYPGLISFVLFVAHFVVNIAKGALKKKSALCKMLLVGCAGYLINLMWVDSLQTLKYLYVLFAIYFVADNLGMIKEPEVKEAPKNMSKYIREKDDIECIYRFVSPRT